MCPSPLMIMAWIEAAGDMNLQGDRGRCRYHSQGSALVNHTAHAHGPCSPGWCFKYGAFLKWGIPLKSCVSILKCLALGWFGVPALRKPPYVLEETSRSVAPSSHMASVCLKMGYLFKWPVKSEENDDYSLMGILPLDPINCPIAQNWG